MVFIKLNKTHFELKNSLINYIVCPTCRNDVIVRIKKMIRNEIIDGNIICKKCKDKKIKIATIKEIESEISVTE